MALTTSFVQICTRIGAGEDPLPCPIVAFWGTRDRRISQAMVDGWRAFTSGNFRLQSIDGHHLWPLEKVSKQGWMQILVDELSKYNGT